MRLRGSAIGMMAKIAILDSIHEPPSNLLQTQSSQVNSPSETML